MFQYIYCWSSPTHHTLDDLILAVVLLHLEKVVAEVEDVKASVLPQQGDDHAAGPVEAVPEALPVKHKRGCTNTDLALSIKWQDVSQMRVLLHSLHCEFVGSHRDAVHELHGTPEAVELHALVHVHHAVAGQRPPPDGVVQEASHACEDDLEHGQTAAQPLFGQEVALTSNGNLLKEKRGRRRV